MLSVRLLCKAYRCGSLLRGSVRTVLRDVSLEVHPGEIVGLVGANGAGKTTILHAIAGLVEPDSGTVSIDGREVTSQTAQRVVALCSSADRSFYYRLTLRQNLSFFGALYGLNGETLRSRIERALETTDLCGFADYRYNRCSTGTRQRLTFARALLQDAPVFLLDEPTRAVDPLHAQRLHSFIRQTLSGDLRKTVILATNNLQEAWEVCDRIVLLSQGRVVDAGTPQALAARFAKRVCYRIEFERMDDDLQQRLARFGRVQRVDGGCIDLEVQAGSDPLQQLLKEILQGGIAVKTITSQLPAPADIFEEEMSG